MRNLGIDPWLRRIVTFAVTVLYFLVDMFEEFSAPGGTAEYGEEGLLEFHHWLQFVVVALVIWSLIAEIRLVDRARGALTRERERRKRLAEDLAGHIAARFAEWKLTAAETEIAWLLIKGFSFAEIADLRGVKERTLRQQASQIYGKADVAGRAELSAAFLEELIGDAGSEGAGK